MGVSVSIPANRRVIMVGLDGAGKTTILYQLKLGDVRHTVPTVGFNVETVKFGDAELPIWDLGGQEKSRALWKHYFVGTSVVIFVVDCSNEDRLDEAKRELDLLVAEEELKEAALLIFANKQDVKGAISVLDLVERWNLKSSAPRYWYIVGCSATESSEELIEGITWISDVIGTNERRKSNAMTRKPRNYGTPTESDCILL